MRAEFVQDVKLLDGAKFGRSIACRAIEEAKYRTRSLLLLVWASAWLPERRYWVYELRT
jgi:hypothetical protein